MRLVLQTGATRIIPLFCTLAGFAVSRAQVNVTTYHNDLFRTGLNSHEAVLTPTSVTASAFGLQFSLPVDGQVYAQPLYLYNVSIPGKGSHAVVYVATEHNSVYAFDANSNVGANATPLWHVNLGPSVPCQDVGVNDIAPEIGITSTPVISLTGTSAGTLYVVAKTKETDGQGNTVYVQRLHALDVTSGAERFGGPVVIQGQVKGTGDGNDGAGNVPFIPEIQNNRAGLLLLSGSTSSTVYIGFASHGDNGPFHGWLFGYDAATLAQTAILNTTPNATSDPSGWPIAAGGIWQGGGGIASDGRAIFFATGNGYYDPTTHAFGDSVVKVNPTSGLVVSDWFTPSNQKTLNDVDYDLGSGGVMLLPASAGSTALPSLMVAGGKEGTVYLLNRHSLGGFHSVGDQVVQELNEVIGDIWGSPAFFNNKIYYGQEAGPLVAFGVSNAQFTSAQPSLASKDFYGLPGPTPSISSNGTGNGIVWAIRADAFNYGGAASLHAYNANNLAQALYDSSVTGGRDNIGPAVKFTTPTVAGGKVYVGTGNSVAVFGLGKWPSAPGVSPASGNYASSISVTATDSTAGAKIYYTTDGSDPSQSSSPYSGPIPISTSTTLKFRAFAPGYGPSPLTERDYQIGAIIGSGTGIVGKYYNNSQNPTGPPTNSRNDPTINFYWNSASPISGVSGYNWAAEWKGYIRAEDTQTYTFTTVSADGVRVWINGQELINDWVYHIPTTDVGSIQLQAGKYYPIIIDYFQGGGSLNGIKLYWQAPGMPFQIVPRTQLYN